MKIDPGALRVASPTHDGGFLSGADLVVEVQKEDGSWLRLRSAVEVTINIQPNTLAVATVGLLTSEIDLESLDPAELTFVRAKLPGVASVTEREAIIRERKAYENGIIRGHACEFAKMEHPLDGVRVAVDDAFPLPTDGD